MSGKPEFEAYFHVPTVEQPRVSPDGKHITYLQNDTGRPELHVVETTTGETRRLTNGALRSHPFRSDFLWTPTGDGLYVSVVPEDDWHAASLHRFALDGSHEKIHDYPGQASLNDVHPRSESLLYASRPSDSEWMPLRRLDLESGDSAVVLECWAVLGGGYNPSGEAACVDIVTESSERQNYVLKGDDPQELTAGGEETGFVGWLDDQQALYAVNSDRAAGAIRDVRTDTITFVGEDVPEDRPVAILEDRLVWRDDSGFVVRNKEMGDEVRINPPRDVSGMIAGGGRLAFILDATDETPSGVATWTPEEGTRVLVQPEYGDVTPTDYIEHEELTVDVAHGEYPVHVYHADEEPAPVIAWVYGFTPGPSDHDVFQPAVQALVQQGYTIAFPGSGAEPPNQIEEEDDTYAYSDAEHEDIASIGHWLAEQAWTDGTVVLGHSHGGYDAAMQAVRYPEPWDAAVDWDGETDLEAHYGANGRPPFYRRCLGPLEDNEAEWRKQSPVTHARTLGVPLLIYHGASDHHVPLEQAQSLRDRLRAWGHERGTDFEYVEAPGEGHMTRAAEHEIRRWKRVLEFLNRHLDVEME